MAVGSLVLGIISIVFALFIPGFQWIGALTGIVGIILGVQARKFRGQEGMATAGMVCSIIGTVLSLILYIACVACVASLGTISTW